MEAPTGAILPPTWQCLEIFWVGCHNRGGELAPGAAKYPTLCIGQPPRIKNGRC